MFLCKKIKLNISEQDATTLEFMQGKCRGLYNWWVMRLRDGEKWRFNACKNPHHYRKAEKRLKRLQRRLSKKQKKSGENQGVSSFPTHLDRIIAQTRCCSRNSRAA